MKKRALSFMLSICVAFSLLGCGIGNDSKKSGKIKVVATVFAQYDFLRNIAGDKIDLSMLMLPGADIHSFDPTPKDIASVQDCDMFVTIGGESDQWVDTILSSVNTDKIEVVKLMDLVNNVVEEKLIEGMESEEEENESEEKELDEHVWTSPKNAIEIVEGLCDKLCKLDTKNEKIYRKNTASYVEKLKKLDGEFSTIVENAKRKEIIVADRFPFRYFADAYNLKYYAAFPGCSTQTGASAKTVSFLIDKVKADKIPVVFHMELSDESMCNTICKETGAKKGQLNAVHNISKDNFDKGVGYIDLMQENVKILKEALN